MTAQAPVQRRDRSAAIAGALALPAFTVGFSFAVLPLVAAVVIGLVVLLVSMISGAGPAGFGFLGFLTLLFGGAAIGENPALVLVPVGVGLVLFAVGIVGSIRFLRARGRRRARAITWAGLGTGLAAQVVVNGTLYFLVLLGKAVLSDGSTDIVFLGREAVPTIVFAALALPATAALGALLWSAFDRRFA